jgi:hypothetical protein
MPTPADLFEKLAMVLLIPPDAEASEQLMQIGIKLVPVRDELLALTGTAKRTAEIYECAQAVSNAIRTIGSAVNILVPQAGEEPIR